MTLHGSWRQEAAEIDKDPAMLRYALIAAVALAATPASAQSLLKGLARSAAEAAVRGAMNRAMTPQQPAPQAEDGGEDHAEAAATPAAPATVRYVSDLPKPPDAADKKKALDEFSRYACNDCEGGRGYDSWPRHGLDLVGYNRLEAKMGGLAVGESVRWKGRVANGQGIVTAEAEQLGFPCKQVTWRMTTDKASMEREGLFCYGYANSYAGSQTWVEVY